MKNSLQGVVVVDLSTEISGPFTSKMLADQGAEDEERSHSVVELLETAHKSVGTDA